jgi:TolB protein
LRFLAILAVLALAACGKRERRALPGAIYYMMGTTLVRHGGGPIIEHLFPSQYAIDGRVIAIYSNPEEGEQLVLLARPDQAVSAPTHEPLGPRASQVRSPAVDPAGKWIVFEAKVEPHSELYQLDLATQRITQLTNNPEGNFAPVALSSTTIAFSSSRDGDAEIYKLDLATKQATRLTTFHRDDWAPTAHGNTIAFMSDREGPSHIFLIDADGTNLRRLTSNIGEEDEPAWSPDGKSIAYTVDHVLHVIDVTTGADRILTPKGASDTEPAWSPDGKWLAVSRDGDIWVTSLDGKDLRPMTLSPHEADHLPRWHAR